jgi:hypothetical protein
MSRLVLSAAASAAVFLTTLGTVAYNADADPRQGHDSVPDVLPEPDATVAKPFASTPPQGVVGPMTATGSPVPLPTTPRHAKPSPATPEPAKTHHAEPRHAKPKHHATRAPDAGDEGPFRDAEGDGKILDDMFGAVVPDGVLPMGGHGGKPVGVSGSNEPVRDSGRHGHHHHHHHWR